MCKNAVKSVTRFEIKLTWYQSPWSEAITSRPLCEGLVVNFKTKVLKFTIPDVLLGCMSWNSSAFIMNYCHENPHWQAAAQLLAELALKTYGTCSTRLRKSKYEPHTSLSSIPPSPPCLIVVFFVSVTTGVVVEGEPTSPIASNDTTPPAEASKTNNAASAP
ncbi:hypothetical protein DFH08DRAFT_1026335 [Mycena albidolilacea]|uniref:Uncharacterized protein n=1 Tax=Mycena albidolilacea TaxID=1033008 RepID=A0AAD6ZKV6_9AGAR|nr:hypothetical protein DFH08DRAFT_1026335 [Mycena albidolilacea]